MPSASSVASSPAAAMTSQMVSAMDQGMHQIAILQQDVSNARQMIDQAIAREVAYVWQQWEHVVDNIFHIQNPALGSAAPQPGSGSGSGSGAMTTALNAPNQQSKIVTQQSGSGSGSGATMTAHENASMQRVMSPTGSGSGSGSGSATIMGAVWLDNDGDGSLDNGELGFQGITVNLIDYSTGKVVDSEITDASGNYQFTVGVAPPPGYYYQILVVFPDGDQATKQGGDSKIDADGLSPAFAVTAGTTMAPLAGLSSTVVTTTQDDANGPIQNQVTLRDAINTVINGNLNQPITFTASGTISLQAALPELSKNVTIIGNNSTIQGQNDPNNPYSIFVVDAGVTAEIDNLQITQGFATQMGGGGILNKGDLTLVDDVIKDNFGIQGGGIYNNIEASLNLQHVSISSLNEAGLGGGIANLGSAIICCGSTIVGNQALGANSSGGGIYNGGFATMEIFDNAQISRNTTDGDGGGVDNEGTFIMHGGSIIGNEAGPNRVGGGIDNFSKGKVTLDDGATVEENEAFKGAGLYLASNQFGSTTTTFDTVTVQNNTLQAGGQGEGVYWQNGATVIPNPPNPPALTDNDDPGGKPFQGL